MLYLGSDISLKMEISKLECSETKLKYLIYKKFNFFKLKKVEK
jgi:hypothetical protein